jgi:enoyl-CoA hydratase
MNTNKVNAQNPAFFDDLHTAFDRLKAEFNDCAVVLTGTGAVFSAGLDFDHHFPLFARQSLEAIDAWFDAYRASNLRLFTYPRPTVAAINGHAYAGGLITALGCDHRIASEGGLQFSLNEVPIGIPMPAVYCEIIKHAIGPRAASELTLCGRVHNLAAALKMGVICETAAPGRLLDDAVAWAALVPPDGYPAYAFAKRALQATTMAAIDAAARLDRDLLSRAMSDPASLRAHSRHYRELKGREITWALPG